MNRTVVSLVLMLLFLVLVSPLNFRTVKAQAAPVLVTNVTPSKTVVGQGFNTVINITIANNGTPPIALVVVVVGAFALNASGGNLAYVNTSTCLVSPGWVSATLSLEWNTTGYAYGNYTIGGMANVVSPGGTPAHNMTDGIVYIGIPGDVNGDGIVNILDSITVGTCFFAKPGDWNWNPNADINDDNITNIIDAIIIGQHFFQHYP